MTTRPAHRTGVLVAALSAIYALGPFSFDMYMPAMPEIGRDLGATSAQVQMTLSICFLGNGIGNLLFGPLSDRFGRRAPAIWGAGFFVLASIGCAVATDIHSLIAMRFCQALGVMAGMISARAVIVDLFEPREMARFASLMSMVGGLAPVAAPLIGGLVFLEAGWRAVFWALAGLGAATAAAVFFTLPETLPREAQLAARRERSLASYGALLRNRPLLLPGAAAALGWSTFGIYLANVSHVLIDVHRVPPEHFGWFFGVNALGLMAAAQLNRWLLLRFPLERVLVWACQAAVAMAALVGAAALFEWGLWGLVGPLFLLVATVPLTVNNATALALGHDKTRAGAATALIGAVSSFTSAAASAVGALVFGGSPLTMAVTMLLLSGAALALVSPAFLASLRRRLVRARPD